MHTVKQHEYARTWLVRVLINCCKDHLRKRQPTVSIKEHYQVDINDIGQILTLRNNIINTKDAEKI